MQWKAKGIYFIILFVLINLINIDLIYAQNPVWQWAKLAGGNFSETGFGIATDSNGNVYITGSFNSTTINFDAITLTNAFNGSNGSSDVFIAKFDVNGNVIWATNAGGTNYEGGAHIATDSNNNVYVTGYFTSPTITFGSKTLTNSGNGTSDIFIVKYDTNGNPLWAKRAGGTGTDGGADIATDSNGNIYLTGNFVSSAITFGSTTLTNAGSFTSDMYIVKYDVNGNVVWAKRSGGASEDRGYGVAADANGNVFVTGYFKSTSVMFGAITLNNAGSNYSDVFTVKYDVNGNAMWAQNPGGVTNESGNGIAVDGNGIVVVAGYFQSPSIAFGSIILNNAVPGYSDVFTVKYDNAGNVLWAKGEGSNGYDEAYSVAIDVNGNVFVTGYFESSTLTIGSNALINQGSSDIFAMKYNATGNIQWAVSAGGMAQEWGYSIATAGSGEIYLTGYFQSSAISFGSTTLTNVSIYDVYVAKLNETTGIEEDSFSEDIKIFPNPFSEYVSLRSNEPLRNTTITLTDVFGKTEKVLGKVNGNSITIYRENLAAGIYFLQLSQNNKIKYSGKIIVSE
jgi:hypothetical protein